MTEPTLKKGLSITPFKSLIPTQDLAPLIASTSIDTITQGIEQVNPGSSSYKILHDEINADPSKYGNIIDHVANEYSTFKDQELDELVFKRQPTIGDTAASTNSANDPPCTQIEGELESRIFNSVHNCEVKYVAEPVKKEQDPIVNLLIENMSESPSVGEKSYSRISELPTSESGDESKVKRKLEDDTAPLSSPLKKQTYIKLEEINSTAISDIKLLISQLDDPEAIADVWLDHDKQIVSTSWLILLQDRLIRVIDSSKFEDLDIDFLIKIQNVCFTCISEGIAQDWSSKSTELTNFTLNSLLSCKTILLIMRRKGDEKKLLVAEHLKSVIDLNYNVIEYLIVPINQGKLENHSALTMISYICDNLTLLTDYVMNNKVDDHFLTRLEYLSIFALYSENYKTKSNQQTLLVNLCWTSAQLIIAIFKSHPDQRQFIIEEILSGFASSKLSSNFTIFRGGTVLMVSVLLLNLVQSFELKKVAVEAAEVIGDNHDDILLLESRVRSLGEDLMHLQDQARNISSDITMILINKLVKQANNTESYLKENFENLIQDLLYLLPFPEWSVSEFLLNSIVEALFKLLENGTSTNASNVESFVLELIGNVGIKLAHNIVQERSADYDNESLYVKTLEYVQIQSNKNINYRSNWNFLLLRYLCKELTIEKEYLEQSAIKGSKGYRVEVGGGVLSSEANNTEKGSPVTSVQVLLDHLANLKSPLKSSLEYTDQSASLYCPVLHSFELFHQYKRFIKIIINSLNSSKVKTRSKSIKILSSISEIDPSLVSSIESYIINKLSDPSPMVRDSVLDLLSSILKPDLIDKFYQPVCERLVDSSISVRKRSIRLIKEIYSMIDINDNNSRKVKTFICTRMLKKYEDEEDSIVEMAKSFLLEAWISSSDDSSKNWVPVEIMMDVVSSPVSKIIVLFEGFIGDILPKHFPDIKSIVDRVLDFVLIDGNNRADLEKGLRLLSMLVKCNGKLMTQDQLISLQPVLVDDKSTGQPICFYTLQILKYVMMEVTILRRDFLEATEQSILRRLTKFSSKELNEAMPCAWKLAKLSGGSIKLANASISCLKHIRPYISSVKNKREQSIDQEDQEPRIRKLLNLIGSFGKFGSFEDNRENFLKANIGLKENESVISLLAKVVLFFCNFQEQKRKSIGSNSIRKTAVKNIVGICSSHPNLFVSETVLKILDREFNAKYDDDDISIKIVIVEGLIEFLEKENEDSKKRQQEGSTKKFAVSLEGNSKFNVNDSICASVIQRFSPSILPLCFYDQESYSYIPIKYLQLVVKLGFANPKVFISSIIALESSTNVYIKSSAIEMHQELFEKHESLTDTSYVEGIKLAYQYRYKYSRNFVNERFFLKNLYSLISYNRTSRRKFIQSITKTFTPPNLLTIDQSQRNLIVFTISNLSTINFVALEDVCFIVYQLDMLIRKEGIDIFETIRDSDTNKEPSASNFMAVQLFIAFLSFKQFLESSYNLSRSQVENFNPARIDPDLRAAPKMVRVDDFILDSCIITNALDNSDNQIRILTTFVERMNQFTN
ncbi:sister chromatid cohesion protein 2 [[Candida] railenensis]|uniref:Sister chromatid cohesion protein n=1 Tax=[Candida] railenensis TaxID=45579 RepID=A0A9P0QTN8_9ASCO|nr:sister chromatid cohesion protein 2 [[Candida] railenensis]